MENCKYLSLILVVKPSIKIHYAILWMEPCKNKFSWFFLKLRSSGNFGENSTLFCSTFACVGIKKLFGSSFFAYHIVNTRDVPPYYTWKCELHITALESCSSYCNSIFPNKNFWTSVVSNISSPLFVYIDVCDFQLVVPHWGVTFRFNLLYT